MEYDQQPELIASHVTKTLNSFRKFEGALSKPTRSNDILEGASLSDFRLQAENDFTRFKMWVGSQAAHRSGPSSLDYRLREAAHLKQQAIYLLKDICESLQSAISLAHGSAPYLEHSQKDGTNKTVQDGDSYFSSPDSGEDDESDFSDIESNYAPSLSLSTMLTDIAEAVDCLLRLSVAIANPAPRDRSHNIATEPSESLSFDESCEPKDITHVRNQFPSIANELAVALGKLLTRRRQFFEYRQAHHEKFSSNKSIDKYYTGLIEEDTLSDDEMFQTTPAHHWLFVGPGQATVPLRPSLTEDGIFECPLCYRMICAKTETAWERHVFGDLRPYKCIYPSCIKTNSDFDSRRNWQSHVSKYHWRSWSCPFNCQQPFSAAEELSSHIREHHLPTGTEDEVRSISALGEREAPDKTPSPCPLCEYSLTGLAEYIDHVGFHLEQLALFALPSLEKRERVPNSFGLFQELHWAGWARQTEWLTKQKGGSNEQSIFKPIVDAAATNPFSAIPPPALKRLPRPSLGPLGKGKEVAISDDAMSDTGSYDLPETPLGTKTVRRDSRNKDLDVNTPVATPDVPEDAQKAKGKGEIQDEEAWPFFHYPPRQSATVQEPPTGYSGRPLSDANLQSIMGHSGPSVSGFIRQSTHYPTPSISTQAQSICSDPPGCSRAATLRPPMDCSSYYMPQQHHTAVKAVAFGSIPEAPVSCAYPGCTVRPFKRKADLERHIRSIHSTEKV